MRKISLLAFLFFSTVSLVLAQSDTADFYVRVFGGTDIEAPTTPTLLTVDPIAPTQIDLTWSMSTDNFFVSGYTIARDGTVIATTTLLNYSDTGLTASTTYNYFVRAFDLSLNYSSSSNVLSATTPELPVDVVATTTPPVSSGGTYARVILEDLVVEVGQSTTSLRLKTSYPSRLEIRFGRTTSYELGYIVGNVFKRDHIFLLSDLEPNTTYDYEIIGYTPSGAETVLVTNTFTTLPDKDTSSPSNVGRFSAVANLDDVNLSWVNPTTVDIAHVRIVRSHLGFPSHPTDGAIVYQGSGNKFTDVDIFKQYSPVYYTAFVYDNSGNVSSGAIAMVYYLGDDFTGISPIKPPVIVSEATSTINEERVTVNMKMPSLSDISIIQLGKKFSMFDAELQLDGHGDFVVLLPVGAVAGNLKSIILTIVDPTNNNQSYSYLMRINNDRTAYLATVPGLGVLGRSQIRVEVFDYEAFMVGTYQTPVEFIKTRAFDLSSGKGIGYFVFGLIDKILLSVLIFCLALIGLLVWRRKKAEDKK